MPPHKLAYKNIYIYMKSQKLQKDIKKFINSERKDYI